MSTVTPIKKKPTPIDELVAHTDLRPITRMADRCHAVVVVELGFDKKVRWLELGQVQLRRQRESSGINAYRLEAYLTEGVCDFEHDSAYALRLPLIGVQLGDLGIHYHNTVLTAWIDPNAVDTFSQDFHVPRPGYDPTKHPKAVTCEGIYDEKKKKYCKWNEGKPHVIVPEGFYVPPFDRELYEAVRGKRVEITIGPTYPAE